MDHHNSKPICSKVNYTQFPTFKAVNLKVLKSVYKKVCQSSLTMPSSSPPNVFKTLNYLKKGEDGWININPICETTQPFKNDPKQPWISYEKMWFCLYKSYLYILQKWLGRWNNGNSTLGLTNSALLLNTCQVSTTGPQGWNNLLERQEKKKTGHLSLKVCIRTHPKSPSQMLWSNPEVFHPISEQSLSFSGY